MMRWGGLILWVLVSLAAGGVGALATRDARDFYAALVKPSWAPPGSLFGPVWTVLYLLMGWRRGSSGAGQGGAARGAR